MQDNELELIQGELDALRVVCGALVEVLITAGERENLLQRLEHAVAEIEAGRARAAEVPRNVKRDSLFKRSIKSYIEIVRRGIVDGE